jgi:arylsulfatase A-like enzyme
MFAERLAATDAKPDRRPLSRIALFSIGWPAAICFHLAASELIGAYPVVAAIYSEPGWFVFTLLYASMRLLVVWFGLFLLVGILPYIFWRMPAHIASVCCLAIVLYSQLSTQSPRDILRLWPIALAVVAALWVERYVKREQGQVWVWVRLPLVLIVTTVTSALLYWGAQFPMREAAGREPLFWVGVAVSITAAIVVFTFRSSRRRWLALALITTGVAFTPTVRALLNENFKIEEYVAPIGETPTPSVVVLILVDTLRADALSYSNRAAGKTSNIDALAADSVDFRNAISTAPWTLPAMNSLMSGLAPLWQPKDFRFLAPGTQNLAEYLEELGYTNRAIIGNLLLLRPQHVTDGFSRIDTFATSPFGVTQIVTSLTARLPSKYLNGGTTEYLTDQAINWIGEAMARPSFLWLHYMDPHEPYQPPLDLIPAGAETKRHYLIKDVVETKPLYLAEVAHVDRQVGRFVQAMKDAGVYDEALIIFTADHGEEFFEHGGLQHGHSLYQELIHVPFLIKLPRQRIAKRVNNFVTTQALLPTVLELVGIESTREPGWVKSLVPLIEDSSSLDSESPIISGATFWERTESQWAVVLRGMKFIHRVDSGREELYDLQADPLEQISVINQHPKIVEQARHTLVQHHTFATDFLRKAGLTDGTAEEELRKRLRSLGYIQ